MCANQGGSAFYYTTNPKIDKLYKDVRRTMTVLRKESCHLDVAYDTFLTATYPLPPDPYSISFGLLSLLVTVIHDQKLRPPLPLGKHLPGLVVDPRAVRTVEVSRAWGVWLNLSTEIRISLGYLFENLEKVIECAKTPTQIESIISELGASPDIRLIDLRKLQRVSEINKPLLLEAADSLHRTIGKVKEVAFQTTSVLSSLGESKDLQKQLCEISLKAGQRGLKDPGDVAKEMSEDLQRLLEGVKKGHRELS